MTNHKSGGDIAAAIPKKLLMDKGWKFDENIVVVVTESEILLRKKDAYLKEKYKSDIEIFEEVLDNLKSKSTNNGRLVTKHD